MGLVIAIPGMVSFMIVGFGSVPDLPLSVGFIWLPAVVIIASAAYFTTPLGARFSVKIDQSQLRRIFGVFLILVGLRLAYGGIQSGGLALFGG